LEIVSGHSAYMNRVVNDFYPSARSATDSYSIYNPDYYWGASVYEKGACVMHMLRCLMGDTAFFGALRQYGQDHAYGNAVTADWQAACERAYGDSLGWFFQPWVYGTRYPIYHLTLTVNDSTTLDLDQVQSSNTLFRMPLDIWIMNTDHDTFKLRLWNDAARTQHWTLQPDVDSLGVHGTIQNVWFDTNSKLLKLYSFELNSAADERGSDIPRDFRISAIAPNPFNPSANISFDLPHPSAVTLRVYNLNGQEVSYLSLGVLSPGSHQTVWNGAPYASGVYLFRLETNHASRIAKAVLLK
jgi:aminopeptidase N